MTESRSVVEGRAGRMGFLRKMQTFLRVMDMFVILIVVMVSQVYTYVKTYQILHFRYVKFIVY